MGINLASILGIGDAGAKIAEKAGKATVDIIAASKGTLTPEDQAKVDGMVVDLKESLVGAMKDQAKNLQDFVLAYEGSAKDVPKWVVVMRSLIRPLFTLLLFAVVMAAISMDFVHVLETGDFSWKLLAGLPEAFWWIFGIVITFWFGDRAVSSVLETKANGKKGV